MEILLYGTGILAAGVAIVGITTNLCIFFYEIFFGRTISFLPIVPSFFLAVALTCLNVLSWYWALAVGLGQLVFDFSMVFLIDIYGFAAREKRKFAKW